MPFSPDKFVSSPLPEESPQDETPLPQPAAEIEAHSPSSLTPEEKFQVREEVFEPTALIMQQAIEEITGEEPGAWLQKAYQTIRNLQRSLREDEHPAETKEYLSHHIKDLLGVLRTERKAYTIPEGVTPGERIKFINERTRAVIHELSDRMTQEQHEQEKAQIEHLSLDDILAHELPEGFALRVGHQEENPSIPTLDVYSPQRQEWFGFPLPPTDSMVHKGGFPRVILKLMYGAQPETIEAELPPNDYDVIAWGDEAEAYSAAEQIGVDLSGVEVFNTQEPDYATWLHTRDNHLNSCFMGKHGLIFSPEAATAAHTGHITPIPSHRGLYGSNMLVYQGELLCNNRDTMRLIKFVAEGKALSFSFNELNKQINIGIYGLVLAEKFLRKPDREVLLEKMFSLFQQIGQVLPGEENIWDTLTRLHIQYPFFNMEKRGDPDDTAVSKWLLGKLNKQALKRFQAEYAIPSLLDLSRSEGDTTPYTVNLANYTPSPTIGSEESIEFMEDFLIASAERMSAYVHLSKEEKRGYQK